MELKGGSMIVNADGAVLGRLASKIAKQLLIGESVTVINIEKSVISGNSDFIFKKYLHKRQMGTHKGPFFPRYPDRIFTRSVKGMLPKNKRGRDVLKKLKVHLGSPEEFKDAEKIVKTRDDLRARFITLEELCKKLGAKI